mgnify:CR=1 FL=1
MTGRDFREVHHVEIRRTDPKQTIDASVKADGPAAVLPLLREILQGREQESFVILILDGAYKVAAWREVARGMADAVGTLDQVVARLASGKRRVAGALAEGPETMVITAGPAPDGSADYRLRRAERGL